MNSLADGGLDYYREVDQRTLTYAIDRHSFPSPSQFAALVHNMPAATKAWEEACVECKVRFVHLDQFDDSPSPEKVNFTVRYLDSRGAFIAASFFPHDPPLRRFINIDPSYFSSGFDEIGVLRHELGHTLGYRHEHIQGVAGCAQEDGHWKPLTPYTPHSVMHYMCGGGGSFALTLQESDIRGHQLLYGAGIDQAHQKASSLVIRFEGGDVAKNVLDVLALLNAHGAISTTTWWVERGDSIGDIYKRLLNLPGSPVEVRHIADLFNDERISSRPLRVGDPVLVPDVTLTTYPFSLTLDRRSEKERAQLTSIDKHWDYIFTGSEEISDTVTRLDFVGYELSLGTLPPTQARAIASMIDGWHRKEILSFAGDGLVAPRQSFSVTSPSDLMTQYQQSDKLSYGAEAALGELINLPATFPCADEKGLSTRVVLLDQPVYRHPDLGANVLNPIGPVLTNPLDAQTGKWQTIRKSFDTAVDHGTHLAGIIGSQKNGFGLIGLAPGVPILSLDWEKLKDDPFALADQLTNLAQGAGFPFVLFANGWQNQPTRGAKALNARLDGVKLLWIVAAGENFDGPDGADISSPSFPLAPMSFGDKYYIVVVTACEKCYSTSPRLMRFANYSSNRDFVQIAAPGDGIPSTISGGGYDRAIGTSQAAALAAGLAAAMVECWPDSYYRQPDKVKFRLQLTSRPSLGEDSAKIQAGIIDGQVAILDPEANWRFLLSDNGDHYQKFDPAGWCDETIRLLDPDDNSDLPPILTSTIRRVVRANNAWVIYSSVRLEVEQNELVSASAYFSLGPVRLESA